MVEFVPLERLEIFVTPWACLEVPELFLSVDVFKGNGMQGYSL